MNNFKTGSTITVTVENPLYVWRSRYASYCRPSQYETFEGMVVGNPPVGKLLLTTKNIHYPIREISLSAIIKVGAKSVNYREVPDQKTFQVAGSKGNTYIVTQNDMHYSCTCPGFQFRKQCKHIDSIRRKKQAA